MNIVEQLEKHGIGVKVSGDEFTFTLPDGTKKCAGKPELEKYLLTCLINYIKI